MREVIGHGKDGSCLLVRIEEHHGGLAMDLAMFPADANGVRLKGVLQ